MRRLALSIDWRDDDDYISAEDVSSYLVGTVVTAEYQVSRDSLVLTYADGRTVTVALHQCKVHTCDETMMVLQEEEE